MTYTLKQAAEAIGKSKPTVLRAIQAGRISATRSTANGGWLIEPAELHRIYETVREAPDETPRNGGAETAETRELRARVDDARETIRDLRARLDTATSQLGEALQQMRLLTDQRVKADPPRGLWGRFLTWRRPR